MLPMQTPFSVVQPGQAITRVKRNPVFPHAGTMFPWLIHPIWAHPVLPGETLKRYEKKWTVVSPPLKSPFCGAWLETFLFYVKLTDIDRDLGQMFIDDGYSTAGYTAAADSLPYYVKSGQIDWIQLCTKRIVEAHFTHENETPRTPLFGLYQAKVNHRSWFQNLSFYADTGDATVAGSTNLSDLYENIQGWQMAQMMAMSEITYEQFLKQYGVQSINAAKGDPEPLRYARSWVKPNNTVEPTTGVPTSAWYWQESVNMDKPKRFTEPGFLIELGVVRPKIFHNLTHSMIGNMWGFSDWFPAYNLKDPTAGIRGIDGTDPAFSGALGTADLPTTTPDFVFDYRDLLNHGEQFVNASGSLRFGIPRFNTINLDKDGQPEDLRGEYVPLTAIGDYSPLFSASAASADVAVQFDGLAEVWIDGHVTDTTR